MDYIADLICSKCDEHGNTLVLVHSVPFGENLAAKISDAVFLYGGSKKNDRREQYDLFDIKDDMIVIATSGIASTGISIDRVKCLIIVDAGKSFIKAIQSVGRGTRLAHDKRKVFVIDIFADLKWSKSHARTRKKWYIEAEYPISAAHKIKLKS
jgi:superfamily II DNA or RNA helicase